MRLFHSLVWKLSDFYIFSLPLLFLDQGLVQSLILHLYSTMLLTKSASHLTFSNVLYIHFLHLFE